MTGPMSLSKWRGKLVFEYGSPQSFPNNLITNIHCLEFLKDRNLHRKIPALRSTPVSVIYDCNRYMYRDCLIFKQPGSLLPCYIQIWRNLRQPAEQCMKCSYPKLCQNENPEILGLPSFILVDYFLNQARPLKLPTSYLTLREKCNSGHFKKPTGFYRRGEKIHSDRFLLANF